MDDPTMSINFLYISGPWQQMFTFPSQDQRDAWMASISELKRAIAAINNDGNAGPPRVPRYQQWLGETQMFVDQWGENYLAPDIKHAINGVEDGIGNQQTVWQDPPENYLVQH